MPRPNWNSGQVSDWGVVPVGIANALFRSRAGDYWHYSPFMDLPTNAANVTQNRIHFMPHLTSEPRLITGVAINCVTQAGAGGVMRLGIYNVNSDFQPSDLLWQDTVDVTTTGVKIATVPDIYVNGLYFIGAAVQGSATVGNYWSAIWKYNPIAYDNGATYNTNGPSGTVGLGATNFATASGAFISNPSMTIDTVPRRRITYSFPRYK